MPTVQEDILGAFYQKLSKLKSIEQATVDDLRKVLESGKKLKAEDLVTVLATDPKSKLS